MGIQFFFVVVVNSGFQLLLPANQCRRNSRYHSGKWNHRVKLILMCGNATDSGFDAVAVKPNPQRHRDYELPHITIQMPVYKEGLRG
jgi:hypothetical protein